ncbi:GntR family transcriptional regulator [Rhodopseudomonas sp. HC1]|uniref:GntR family transcriptional regulator n=1 Tax=Rhodopseudomonas infernalis TaxID=2897386 RepID=UPI001EE7F805|nr:GntR family transcriptional regulator [Rhodopseudomonas infernalis]MCG6203501.1 GntR family transcriptional regulator [Rhodopseudomonas infernalis]
MNIEPQEISDTLKTSSLLRDSIYARLREEILGCRMAPGEELREQELAVRFEVSKQPVREALLRLEQERLITVLPRQGYRVKPVSIADARDIFRFREIIEPACAADAAQFASDAQLRSLDEFRSFDAPAAEFIKYNRAFHIAVAMCSPHRRMREEVANLVSQADRLVLVSIGFAQGRDTNRLLAEHVAIIDALQARDGRQAARLLRTHIIDAQKRVVANLSRHAVIL